MNITGRGLFGKLCVCEHLRQTYAAVLPASRVIFPAKSAKLWVFRRSFASQNGEALCPVTHSFGGRRMWSPEAVGDARGPEQAIKAAPQRPSSTLALTQSWAYVLG